MALSPQWECVEWGKVAAGQRLDTAAAGICGCGLHALQ